MAYAQQMDEVVGPPPQYFAQQPKQPGIVQQQVVQQPMVTQTTTNVRDTSLDAAQMQRTTSLSHTLSGFAVFGALLGLSVFLLNTVPIGQGVRVYNSIYNYYSNEYTYVKVNYYPGIWYGLLNLLSCIGVLAFAQRAVANTRQNADYILNDGAIRTSGALMSTLFAILSCVGIGAITCAAITTVTLDHSLDFTDCTYNDALRRCTCSNSYYVSDVDSCDYAWNTLFAVYRAITSISAVLVVIDIIIASLFCGVLCCCVISTPYHMAMPMGVGAGQVIVTQVPAQQQFIQPATTAYIQTY
ncbi:uncharacterized protein LOC135811509 [Sycon ciliatum]|uniref:uncharacterized protein LOC135811509 n=1 Tax=Sycon ciliatum TaxID=27933 RepID=UPI0020AD1A9E|eukprot:scpid70748/ scgid27413/ 